MSYEDLAKDTVKGVVLKKVVDQFILGETQVQFDLPGDVLNPAAGILTGEVPVTVANGVGVKNSFAERQTVSVNIAGGTATGKQLSANGTQGAINASVIAIIKDGVVVVTVTATVAGTVNLSLSSPSNTDLAVTDTAVVTFS